MEHSKKLTFLDFMGRITDPRKPYNQLHAFLDIVAIAVLATLCGADTWNEIELWGNGCKEWLATFLILKNGIPSHDTFNRVFQMIDPEEFHRIFLEWIQEIVKVVKGVVSIDGKTVRRSRDGKTGRRPFMSSAPGPGSFHWFSVRKRWCFLPVISFSELVKKESWSGGLEVGQTYLFSVGSSKLPTRF